MARMIYNLNKGLVTGWRALSPVQLGGLPRPDKSQPDGICRLDRTPDLLTSSHALVHRGHNPSKLVHPLRLELSVRLADRGFSTGNPEMLGGSCFRFGGDAGIGWTGSLEGNEVTSK